MRTHSQDAPAPEPQPPAVLVGAGGEVLTAGAVFVGVASLTAGLTLADLSRVVSTIRHDFVI
jgi:hypothetical protein